MDPEEFFQAQEQAQANFVFECEDCGSDNVEFWSRGRRAGQARCKSCGNTWMWKDKMATQSSLSRQTKEFNPSDLLSRNEKNLQTNTGQPARRADIRQDNVMNTNTTLDNADEDEEFDRMLAMVQRGEDPLESFRQSRKTQSVDIALETRYSEPQNQRRTRQTAIPAMDEIESSSWPTTSVLNKTTAAKTSRDDDDSSTSEYEPVEDEDSGFMFDENEETLSDREPEPPTPVRKQKKPRAPRQSKPSGSTQRPTHTTFHLSSLTSSTSIPKDVQSPTFRDETDLQQLIYPDTPTKGKGKENINTATSSSTGYFNGDDMIGDDEDVMSTTSDSIPNGFDGFSDDEDNGLQAFKLDYPKKRKATLAGMLQIPSAKKMAAMNMAPETLHKERYCHFKPRPTNRFNPYLLYNRTKRKELAEAQPGLSTKELSSMVSKGWKTMDPETKQQYYDEAKRLKDEANKARGHRGRNERFPANPYILFTKEVGPKLREEHPDYGLPEINRVLVSQWSNLNDDEKKIYRDKYAELKAKFIEENPDYMEQRKRRINESRRKTAMSRKAFR